MNRTEVAALFALFDGALLPRPTTLQTANGFENAIRVWAGLLADENAASVMTAAAAYLRRPDARFWPSPGVLLELMPGRSAIDDSDAAWGLMLRSASRYGRERPPTPALDWHAQEFSTGWALDDTDIDRDAAIHSGIEALGGWRAVCRLDVSDYPTARHSFRNAYRAAMARRRRHAGLADAAALIGGGPKLIGRNDAG